MTLFLRRFAERYAELRTPTRALLRLHWVYAFAGALWGVFIHIYIYGLFADVSLNMVSTLIEYLGIMVGFCVIGAVFAAHRVNLRYGFLIAFIILGTSFLFLLSGTTYGIFLYMLVSGIGHGIYWLSLHTYELHETRDHERDFYSSVLSSGGSMLAIAAPLIATGLLLIASSAGWDQFALFFFAAPALYLLASSNIRALSDYRAQPIVWGDITHFFLDPRNRRVQLYLAGTSSQDVFRSTIVPLVSVVVLGSAVNVGVFNTILALISAVGVALLGAYRHRGNRLSILGLATFVMIPLIVLLGWTLSFAAFVLFQIGKVFVGPLAQVSSHVINLQTMESIGRKGSDFYATMLLRDFSLWFWRSLGGLIFLAIAARAPLGNEAFSYGMYLFAGAFLITFLGASRLLRSVPVRQAAQEPSGV